MNSYSLYMSLRDGANLRKKIGIRIPLFAPQMGTFLCHSSQRNIDIILTNDDSKKDPDV